MCKRGNKTSEGTKGKGIKGYNLRPLQLVIMFMVHRPHPFLENVKCMSYFWKLWISEIKIGLQQVCMLNSTNSLIANL